MSVSVCRCYISSQVGMKGKQKHVLFGEGGGRGGSAAAGGGDAGNGACSSALSPLYYTLVVGICVSVVPHL